MGIYIYMSDSPKTYQLNFQNRKMIPDGKFLIDGQNWLPDLLPIPLQIYNNDEHVPNETKYMYFAVPSVGYSAKRDHSILNKAFDDARKGYCMDTFPFLEKYIEVLQRAVLLRSPGYL